MRRTAMIAGWLAATAATTTLAYVAVDAAGSKVSDRPLTALAAATATTATTSAPTSLPTTASTTSTTATTSTTSGSPATTSPPTTPAAEWKQQTINSAAGTVVVSYRPDQVRLESVAPLVGFTYEVDKDGPDEVRVEFDGLLRVEVRARWQDGQLVTEINES